MKAFNWLFLTQLLSAAVCQGDSTSVDIIPSTVSDGPSNIQYNWTGTNLDGPKVKPFNASSFEWWYFDAISSDLDYSLVLVFHAAGPNAAGQTNATIGSAVSAEVDVTLADGSAISVEVAGDSLTIVTEGDGSTGVLNGTGWSWIGQPDLSRYDIAINDTTNAVIGTVSLNSVRFMSFSRAFASLTATYTDSACPSPLRSNYCCARNIHDFQHRVRMGQCYTRCKRRSRPHDQWHPHSVLWLLVS